MKDALRTSILAALFAMKFLSAQTQTQILPQAPDGAGWQFTLVVTNPTTNGATAQVNFFRVDDQAGDTFSWVDVPLVEENVNLGSLDVPPASSVFLHSTGIASTLTQGWAQMTSNSNANLQAYIIYTYTAANQSTSDATAPAVTPTTRILVPFDNTATATNALATELAIVNPNVGQETVTVSFSIGGQNTAGASFIVPGMGQVAVAMPDMFPETLNQAGLAEFSTVDGNLAIIALRSNNNAATGLFSFTSAPTYPESGSPIIIPGTADSARPRNARTPSR